MTHTFGLQRVLKSRLHKTTSHIMRKWQTYSPPEGSRAHHWPCRPADPTRSTEDAAWAIQVPASCRVRHVTVTSKGPFSAKTLTTAMGCPEGEGFGRPAKDRHP